MATSTIALISCLLILVSLHWAFQLLGVLQPLHVTVQLAHTRTISGGKQWLLVVEWGPARFGNGSLRYIG